ncbi:MAG: phage tail tape measure protein, partial [Dehalococcoidia bacterium]
MSETPGGGIKFVIDADIPADEKIRQVTAAFIELQRVSGTGTPTAIAETSAALRQVGNAAETEGEKLIRMSRLYSTAGMSVAESAKFQGKSIAEVNAALGNTTTAAQSTAAAMHTVAASGKDVLSAFQAQLNPTTQLGVKLGQLEAAGFTTTQIFAVLNGEIQRSSATALANQQAIHPLVGTYLGMATALQTAADAAMRMNATLAQTSSLGGLAQTEAIRRATLGQAGGLGGIPVNAANIPAINAATAAMMEQNRVIAAGAPVVAQQTGLLASMGITMGHVKNMALGLLVYRVIWGAISGVTGAIKGTIDAAIDFEKAFAEVKRTVGGTVPEMAQLHGEILKLSAVIPVTALELSKIAAYAGQLGIETPNIAKFTETIARMAASSNLSMEEAASGLAKFMQIMGTPQVNVDRLASVVVKLGVSTAATEGEIMKMAFRLAGAGNMVGLTEAQVLALSSTLGSLGMRADLGGSAVSKTFRDMARAVGSDLEKLTGFATVAGMSAQKFANIFKRDAAEALLLFLEGLSKYKGSAPEMIALLDELGMKQSRQIDALSRAGGAVDEFRKQMDMANKEYADNTKLLESSKTAWETTRDEIEKTKNSWYALAVEIGNAVLGMGSYLAQSIRIRDAKATPVFPGGGGYTPSTFSAGEIYGKNLESAMQAEADRMWKSKIGTEIWHPPMALTQVMDAVLPKTKELTEAQKEQAKVLEKINEQYGFWIEHEKELYAMAGLGGYGGVGALGGYKNIPMPPLGGIYEAQQGLQSKLLGTMDTDKEIARSLDTLDKMGKVTQDLLDKIPELKDVAKTVDDVFMKPGTTKTHESDFQRWKDSYESGKRSIEGQVAMAKTLLATGKDLGYVYESFGTIIEKYPEYFSKAQWAAAQMGRMQEVINGGWLNIGNTIENALGDSVAKMSFNIKSIFASIRDSWNQMIGDMVSSFLHGFLRPLMANLGNSMAALFGRTGFGAAMGGGGASSVAAGGASWFANGFPSGAPGVGSSGGASGGGGWAGALGGSLGSILGGAGSGAMLGSQGGPYGAIAGGLGGGLLTAGLMGMMPHMVMAGTPIAGMVGGGMGGMMAGMGAFLTNPFTIGAAVAAIAGTLIYKSLTRGGTPAGAKESGRDYGVSVTSQTIEQFIASIGLSKSGYEGVRKDIS